MAGKIIVDTIDTDNAFITLNVQQSLIATMNVSGIFSNTGVKMIGANGTVSNTAITGLVTASQIATVANTQITGNITSSQITSNPTLYGNVSVTGVIGVGGATTSTSGSGISFPATQSASTDANTLDDYEEGTYTPTITFNTTNGNLTYSVQVGRYIKIGQLVYVGGQIVFAQTTASSYFFLDNLPFTSKNVTNFSPSTGCGVDGMNGLSGGIYIQISANSVAAYPYQSQTGVSNIIVAARCNGGSATITWGFTYLSDV